MSRKLSAFCGCWRNASSYFQGISLRECRDLSQHGGLVLPPHDRSCLQADRGSPPIEHCILTATMGNLARTRLLWLKDGAVSSLKLYPEHQGDGFAPHQSYPLERLTRTPRGDVMVAVTNDEDDPALIYPFPGRQLWHYGGCKVTQFWKKPRGTICTSLSMPATPIGKRAGPYPAGLRLRTLSCGSASTKAKPSSSGSPARRRRS
jgi:hypothetical protein